MCYDNNYFVVILKTFIKPRGLNVVVLLAIKHSFSSCVTRFIDINITQTISKFEYHNVSHKRSFKYLN